VLHCELKFGDSLLNLGESMEGWPEHNLLAQIFVADADAVFAQAVKPGAEVLNPVTTHVKAESALQFLSHRFLGLGCE
jgi:PhnB protein